MQTRRDRHHDHTQEHSHSHGHSHVEEDMLNVEDAFARIMACFSPLSTETKPLMDCLGQVLAEDVTSPLALPPMANSGMDGYAVRQLNISGASGQDPILLNVIGLVAAAPRSLVEALGICPEPRRHRC